MKTPFWGFVTKRCSEMLIPLIAEKVACILNEIGYLSH
jgi:hypothetical protein